MDELKIPEKFILSVKEAALYFGMGEKKIRRMAEDNEGDFALYNGNRYLVIRPMIVMVGKRKMINRTAFQEYLCEHPELRRKI